MSHNGLQECRFGCIRCRQSKLTECHRLARSPLTLPAALNPCSVQRGYRELYVIYYDGMRFRNTSVEQSTCCNIPNMPRLDA